MFVECGRRSNVRSMGRVVQPTSKSTKRVARIAQSITEKSHHETKINALLALSNIGTIVAIGGDRSGAELRKHVGHDDGLVKVMLDITDLMTVNEQRALSSDDMQALEEFDKERKRYCVFDGFKNVLDVFKKAKMEVSIVANDERDDDDYGDIDEQALLNKSDAIEGSASQPITI